ncbi:MAG: NADP-dependent isocitrate dehydrogenase [Clostridia bacterium]|nr:NADP-dependent isocitrate dehydrogenase [Clostridia bacterium]
MKDYESILSKLKKYGQEDVLRFYGELSADDREQLLCDVESLDLDEIAKLYHLADVPAENKFDESELSPIDVIKAPVPGDSEYKTYYEKGIEVLRSGKVIAVTMAGGEGSRLGHNGPKGTYDPKIPGHGSLFEIQLEGLRSIHAQCGSFVHWYIMTGESNHAKTVEYFEENAYFGYPRDKVTFFKQGVLPVLDLEGKLLLEEKNKILKAPDGNGGIFRALLDNKILETGDAADAGYVFVCGIDNCLVKMCDPVFVGAIALTGRACLTKTFMKRSPEEKAGIYCLRNGRPLVIEYTEISAHMAAETNADGTYKYGDANVLNYIFDINRLREALSVRLPYHIALKKVKRLDGAGNPLKSEVPDCRKYEMFMFDIFNEMGDTAAFRIVRDEEFAPVKNAEGIDSAQTARELFMRQNRIEMENPIVEIDGDEMTRIVWEKIKEIVLEPYVKLNTEYYDLSVQNRDATDDTVTVKAAEAIKKHKVAVKCATITPNAKRVEEFGLKKMWKSPNATIRGILDGTVFRTPIIVDGISPVVRTWEKPITIARHAYGDIYSAVETRAAKGDEVFLTVKSKDGGSRELLLHTFADSDGIVMGMHNEDDSVESFARTCFGYALSEGLDLWFSAKDTISKTYDHRFKDVFAEIYENEFREAFEEKGITYFYTLVDDAVSRVMKSKGGFVWACKNYDGDVFSDMLASAFGSLSMMTSVLVSPDGCFEYEAAHGTIPRHYHKYLNGEKTSTNPTATLFAWTGALAKKGMMDGNAALADFSQRVENALYRTISEGFMTGDLALITEKENPVTLGLEEFLEAVRDRIFL